MAVRYVRDILHKELISAFSGSTVFDTVKRGSLMGGFEQFDSAKAPALIIESPKMNQSRCLSAGSNGGTGEFMFHVDFYIYGTPRENPEKIEDDVSVYQDEVRTKVNAYSSDLMRRIGWCKNTAQFEDVGYIQRGQNYLYHMVGKFRLFGPMNAMVDDGVSGP